MAVSARALLLPDPFRRSLLPAAAATLAALTLAACGDAAGSPGGDAPNDTAISGDDESGSADAFPVVIDNCGVDISIDAPPSRAITMNQAATEVMLALGLEAHMAGTAYLDDAVLPELAAAYASVPVIAEQYPSPEVLLDAEPDVVYAAYPSAFTPEHAGERGELAALGIATYLSPSSCPDAPRGEPLDIHTVWQEITEVGTLFGAAGAAEALVTEQRRELDEALETAGDLSTISVMWWDGGDDAPTIGACCGAPGMIMDAAGVENVFADVEGRWADVSWEQVTERDPDVIVLVDADWSPAEGKREVIESTPGVRELAAVRNERYVVLPFSATTPGVRNVSAVVDFVEQLDALAAL